MAGQNPIAEYIRSLPDDRNAFLPCLHQLDAETAANLNPAAAPPAPRLEVIDEIKLKPNTFIKSTGRILITIVDGVTTGSGKWPLSESEYDRLTPGQLNGTVSDLDLKIGDGFDGDGYDTDELVEFEEYEDVLYKIYDCFKVFIRTMIKATEFDECIKKLILSDNDCFTLFSNITTYRISSNGRTYLLSIRLERSSFNIVFNDLINKYIN